MQETILKNGRQYRSHPVILDYMNVFARYSLKLTFRKY
jgi:hypothetical protein